MGAKPSKLGNHGGSIPTSIRRLANGPMHGTSVTANATAVHVRDAHSAWLGANHRTRALSNGYETLSNVTRATCSSGDTSKVGEAHDMRRWKREWEIQRQYDVEEDSMRQHNLRGLRRFVDYTVVGLIAGGCVLVVHLLDATLSMALTLSGIATAFVILALVFFEKTDEERMLLFIHELLEHGVTRGPDDGEEEEEANQ